MITEENVKKVARLAKLEIKKEDVAQLTQQLGEIITYIETLHSLKLDGIKPTAHAVEVKNVFRDDVVVPTPGVAHQTLEKAPQADGEFFRVPKIL